MKKLLIGITLLASVSSFANSAEDQLSGTEILRDTAGKIEYVDCNGEYKIKPDKFLRIATGFNSIAGEASSLVYLVHSDEGEMSKALGTPGLDMCSNIKIVFKK